MVLSADVKVSTGCAIERMESVREGLQGLKTPELTFFIFLVVLGFEFGASHLLGSALPLEPLH
jgi:hypothetical protein